MNCYITPLPKNVDRIDISIEGFDNVFDWRDRYCIFYDWYVGNKHHWLIPNAIEFIKNIGEIEGFKINENFEYVSVPVLLNKTLMNKKITDIKFKGVFEVHNYSNNFISKGNYDILRWNKDTKWYPKEMFTEYHSSFYGSHSVSTTLNKSADNKNSIIVISDSMCIGFAKVLINSFYKTTIIDSRHFNVDKLNDLFNINEYDFKFVLFTQGRKNDVLKYYNKIIGKI